MSDQKYAPTAMSVPRWSATSKVWLKLSCCFQVGPVGSPGNEDQVARRGDRKQLGEPLNEPEDEGLGIG